MGQVLVLLLVLASRALALEAPFITSGFDGADQSTSNTDSYEFTAFDGGTDSRVNIQKTRVHDSTNGGDSSSRWALQSTVTTLTTSGYYTVCIPATGGCSDINPRETRMFVGVSVNLDTPPGAGDSRTILAMTESDADYGCAVAVDENRKPTLFYAGGTSLGACPCGAGQTCQGGQCRVSWGTADLKFNLRSCVGNVQASCLEATQATDCASGDCSATTHYWAGVELGQIVSSSSQVTCELYVDGAPVYTGTVKSITGTNPVQSMKNVAFGVVDGPGTVDGVTTVYMDDLVLDDGDRAGWGYVARKIPTVSGGLTQWSAQTGSGCTSTTRVACVNDYDTGPDYVYNSSSTGNLFQKNLANRTETFTSTGPDLVLAAGRKVTAVEGVVFGNTTVGSGLRDIVQKLLFGTAGVESVSPVQVPLTSGSATTPRLWDRYIVLQSPVVNQADLSLTVNHIGHAVVTGPNIADTLRVGTMLVYVRVRKPDITGGITLGDHNKGTEDGLRSVFGIGDSTLIGTAQQSCIGGTAEGVTCTQNSYASWDTSVERDKPTGGCGSDLEFSTSVCTDANTSDVCDVRVKTCKLQRQLFNAGAGLRCTSGADCNLTCSGSFCETADGPTPISCSTENDCDLGDGDAVEEASDCDTGATCVVSCPGGQCPTGRTGWMGNLASSLAADVIVACGQGGEQISEMYVSRFAEMLDGRHASCSAVSGSGQCTCSSGSDCGGGTCTGGLCVVGATTYTNCTQATDCPTGLCAFPPPDYLVTLMGYNEMNPFQVGDRATDQFGWHTPNCEGANAWRQPVGCPTYGSGKFQLAKTDCTKDSECSSISPYSVCGGWCIGVGKDFPCRGSSRDADCGTLGTCTTEVWSCNNAGSSGAGCTNLFSSGGPTCDGGSTSILPLNASGVCRCTTNGQCASGYKCVGDTGKGICRKACTSDTQCSAGMNINCITFSGSIGNGEQVCEGRCTLPCDAISCDEDTDCAPEGGSALTQRFGGLVEPRWWGTCNLARGKCANCGPAPCGGNQTTAPCTCTGDAECGSGGSCVNNVCALGDAARTACRTLADCATDRQCLRPDIQGAGFHAQFSLAADVGQRMTDQVSRLGDSTPPVLLWFPPPQLNGMVQGTGAVIPDRQCGFVSAFQNFYDRNLIDRIRRDWLAAPWIPDQRVIDVAATWDANKQILPYHSDQVHFAPVGANLLSQLLATSMNKLNVCLKVDGTVQLYCQSANGSFPGTTCTVTADCSGGICVRRPCNGSAANCPDSTDSCGPD